MKRIILIFITACLLILLPTFLLAQNHLSTSRPTSKPVVKINNKPRQAIIVIDPGHGGKDPGATGPQGVHEKNVVLAICKDLQADLQKNRSVKVYMTRSGNYFVTLAGRLKTARKDKADLFIAVHADSFPDKTAHGASVFALSEHGATTAAARWLADSENRSVLGGAQFKNQSKVVQSVLLSLSLNATIEDSLVFGSDVIRQLKSVTNLHSRHVDQAPFMVLKNPDIPSILVETGFISNAAEEQRLNNPQYQQKVALALANGIMQYLKQNPPQNWVGA